MLVPGIALSILIGVSLGFFGGGGSILTVPLLVYVFGLPPKEAIATSLLIVGIASSSGVLQHWRAGNVRLGAGLVFGLSGMLGAYAGGRASAFLDGGLLLLLFAAMMLSTSAAMWRGRKEPTESNNSQMISPAKLALQGLVVGSFTGLVGAGGGFLIVPALALWSGLPMTAAVGTSLLIIALNCGAGFLGYLNHVEVDYGVVVIVSAMAIVGSFLGSRLATVVEPSSLRRAFAGFVMTMAVFILLREGALVLSTFSSALPRTWPQVVFALVMLGLGILAGRSSKNAAETNPDFDFSHGAGI